MSTIRRFTVLPNDEEPIAFELTDAKGNDIGGGPFRVTRKPRLDLSLGMAQAVTLNGGKRIVDQNTMLYVLRELLITEYRDPETDAWVPADDRERWDSMLSSDRHKMDWVLMSEITMWLAEALQAHPTGASSLS